MASIALVLVAAACAPPPVEADGPFGVTMTRNVRIRLDDGRVLSADVYQPTDPSTGAVAPGPFPVILGFTPYGKTLASMAATPGGNGLNLQLVRHGYIGAVVDVPGTGGSDGAFDLFDRAEAVAGAEVVRWAADLPRSTGEVGMVGLSYLAIDQLFTAAEVGPGSPLKAIFPMAATVDPYRDLFTSGGALNVMSPLGLLFGYGGARTITPFVEEWDDLPSAWRHAGEHLEQMGWFEAVMARDMVVNGPRRYDGEWWEQRRPGRVLQRIVDNGVAVYLVGGLYDVFQRGEPLLYSGLQNAWAGRDVDAPMTPDQPASDRFRLLTGPWTHGDMGAGLDMSAIQLEWFDHWLKDGPAPSGSPLTVIEPGGATYDATTYPLADASPRRWWLRSDGRLDDEPPSGAEPTDRIDYNPFGPICTASTVQFAAGFLRDECLVPSAPRPDEANEVTYATDPLDSPVQLAGPIVASLSATSSAPDAVFHVTVEDVAQDGSSMAVTGGALLGSMRELDPARSWTDASGGLLRPHQVLTREAVEAVPIGAPVRYEVEVRPAFATIPAGHRLRVRVSTADLPHIVPLADLFGLLGGHQDIHHDAVEASYVDVSVRTGG